MSRHHGDKKKLGIVFILTVIYMFAEIVGGILSGSLSLLADSGHMAIDAIAIGFGLFASHHSHKVEKIENYIALLNGVFLVLVSFWIFYEAWQRLMNPITIQGRWMLGVASGGLLVNLIGVIILHERSKENLNMKSVRLHLLTDLLGSVTAIIAGILVWRLGWLWADPAFSFLIAFFIFLGALRFIRECMVELNYQKN